MKQKDLLLCAYLLMLHTQRTLCLKTEISSRTRFNQNRNPFSFKTLCHNVPIMVNYSHRSLFWADFRDMILISKHPAKVSQELLPGSKSSGEKLVHDILGHVVCTDLDTGKKGAYGSTWPSG